ncbi:hypothetical protein BDC45DRAFT_511279 [Circinella umbellata]|nr:hypothetical protein BDC45DRAFT_511279 [Circinella umbellata]
MGYIYVYINFFFAATFGSLQSTQKKKIQGGLLIEPNYPLNLIINKNINSTAQPHLSLCMYIQGRSYNKK